MWEKLQSTFQSKGPARKATLLKKVALARMKEGDSVRDHLNDFFDAVKKLKEINVSVTDDLLSILLLYSLPESFETFRCALETRDDLPKPDALRVKIIEEDQSRRTKEERSDQNALYTKNGNYNHKREYKKREANTNKVCYKCGKLGHFSRNCRSKPKTQYVNTRYANEGSDLRNEKSLFNVTESAFSCHKTSNSWCLDSGCTSHMSAEKNNFQNLRNINKTLNLANGNTTRITGIGNIKINIREKGRGELLNINDVMYVEDLRANLLSISKITDKGYEVHFRKNEAVIIDNNEVLCTANRIGNLYYIDDTREAARTVEDVAERNEDIANAVGARNELDIWHRKFGHLNEKDLKEAIKSDNVHSRGLILKKGLRMSTCEVCISEKQTRTTFTKGEVNRTSSLLEIIHSDVCGPMRCSSNSNARYFVTFIDDKSRWCEVYFLKKKSDTFSAFQKYKAAVENYTGRKIKSLQSDNGTEYRNREFDTYLEANGISRRLSTPYTPQQNGIAERKNRTLVEMARCMMKEAEAPPSFWAEAINTASYIRNRCITKANNDTPYRLWTGKKPSINHFQIFGCKTYVLNKNPEKGKFDSRSEQCVFVGYSSESKAYRMWSQRKKHIIISRDVKFVNENGFHSNYEDPYWNRHERKIVEITGPNAAVRRNTEEISESSNSDVTQRDNIEEIPQVSEETPRIFEEESNKSDSEEETNEDSSYEKSENHSNGKTKRGRGRPKLQRTGLPGRPKKVYQPAKPKKGTNSSQHQMSEDEEFEDCEMVFHAFTTDPSTYKDAMSRPDAAGWTEAIEDEFLAQIQNKTWEIVQCPEERRVIGSRLVLHTKNDGITNSKKKARLVAKGFAQREGIDFHDTYSPVARLSSVRLLTAMAAEMDLEIHQMDVVTAYLNGELDEKVYMQVPEQLETILGKIRTGRSVGSKGKLLNDHIKETTNKWLDELQRIPSPVCLLKKALYGLRQSGLMWYHKLTSKLKQIGLQPTNQDPCLFTKRRGHKVMLVTVYVDDLLLASNDKQWLTEIKQELNKSFEMKDIGTVKRCLGIDFNQKLDGHQISLSQHEYSRTIIERFGMTECKAAKTPMEKNLQLTLPTTKNENNMYKFPYQRLIGALMYLAVTTRPDIAFAVNMSQFNSNYDEEHWKAAKRILRYIKGTLDHGITYEKCGTKIYGLVDADWGSNISDRRSYSGFAFILGKAAISWEARKQRTVSLSSTEAEYIAISEATKEALYLQGIIGELGFPTGGITLFNDSQSAQKLVKCLGYRPRSKHIDIRHHFVRECLRNGKINLEFMPTDKMPADVLTKSLNSVKHQKCITRLGLAPLKYSNT